MSHSLWIRAGHYLFAKFVFYTYKHPNSHSMYTGTYVCQFAMDPPLRSEQRGWPGCLFLQYAWEDLCKVLTVPTTLGEVFTDVPVQTCPTVVAQNLWWCGLGSPLESAGWWSPPSHPYQKGLPPHHKPSVRVNNERAYPVKGVCMWCDRNQHRYLLQW